MRMSNRVVQVYTKPNSVHFSGSAQVDNENDFVELKPWAVPCGTKLSTALGMFFFLCVCVCLHAFGLHRHRTRQTLCFPWILAVISLDVSSNNVIGSCFGRATLNPKPCLLQL